MRENKTIRILYFFIKKKKRFLYNFSIVFNCLRNFKEIQFFCNYIHNYKWEIISLHSLAAGTREKRRREEKKKIHMTGENIIVGSCKNVIRFHPIQRDPFH